RQGQTVAGLRTRTQLARPRRTKAWLTLLGSWCCAQLIEDRVEPLVDYLLIRIGMEPVEDMTCAECEGNRAGEFRHLIQLVGHINESDPRFLGEVHDGVRNRIIGLWTEIRGAQIQTGTDQPERPRWVYCI